MKQKKRKEKEYIIQKKKLLLQLIVLIIILALDKSTQEFINDVNKRKKTREYDKLLKERIKLQQIEDVEDKVYIIYYQIKYNEKGWKKRYYSEKFKKESLDPNFKKKLTLSYVKGLCWVLLYYYQGCPSWSWFYPYHYAPCASDLKDFSNAVIKFDLGKPYKPLQQLMAVLPPASKQLLPNAYAEKMTNSNLSKYYPKDFKLDPNGHPQKWLWVALLPFIPEKELMNALEPLDSELNDDEKDRNSFSKPLLLVFFNIYSFMNHLNYLVNYLNQQIKKLLLDIYNLMI